MSEFDLVFNGLEADKMGTLVEEKIEKEIPGGGCPMCGSTKVHLMSFEIDPDPSSIHARLLKGAGKIKGSYVKCSECKWKSKAMMYR